MTYIKTHDLGDMIVSICANVLMCYISYCTSVLGKWGEEGGTQYLKMAIVLIFQHFKHIHQQKIEICKNC